MASSLECHVHDELAPTLVQDRAVRLHLAVIAEARVGAPGLGRPTRRLAGHSQVRDRRPGLYVVEANAVSSLGRLGVLRRGGGDHAEDGDGREQGSNVHPHHIPDRAFPA